MSRETFMETMAAEIERRQDELIALETAYEKMGGVFDAPEPAAKMKLLTGPKAKKARKKKRKSKTAPPPVANGTVALTINGKSIDMKKSQRSAVEIMLAGAGHVFSSADVTEMAGKKVANPTSFFKQINRRLEPAQVHIVNVPRQGWKLEKLPA